MIQRLLLLLLLWHGAAAADTNSTKEIWLQSYEPTTFGFTNDSNDVPFMDFTISLKYPLFHKLLNRSEYVSWLRPYIAFTGRFGQYVGFRESSPVIAKRFNPKLFFRVWKHDSDNYVDLAYAHESNGQRVDDNATYDNMQQDFVRNGENADFAKDYISRGWDFLELRWKHRFSGLEYGKLLGYLNLKYFLDYGLLQGAPEEYNSFEGPSKITRRSEVDGISVLLKYQRTFAGYNSSGYKLALLYTTGYQMFKNNTLRAEATLNMWGFPVMIWGSSGYGSDLVDYNVNVLSGGMALELKSFF